MFIKENVNPRNKKTCDCTTRAITKASGKSYNDILDMQIEVCKQKGYFVNDPKTGEEVLKRLGFSVVKVPVPQKGEKRLMVKDIEKRSKGKRIVCSIANHWTCCVGGNIYDLWDCSDKAVYKYYEREF